MRPVADTNIFFPAFNPKSRYYPIVSNLISKKYSLLISTPILLEYEEIPQMIFPKELPEQFWLFLLTSEQCDLY
jgi:predicted nucleic acid-binding protein